MRILRMTTSNIDDISKLEKEELVALIGEMETRQRYDKINFTFPPEGPLSRDKYPKQLEFFKAGKTHKERAFIAGNRTGKTFCATYELVLHLTGLYPEWWEGRRFTTSIDAWAAGQTNETTRFNQGHTGAPS